MLGWDPASHLISGIVTDKFMLSLYGICEYQGEETNDVFKEKKMIIF